ncbi:MAG: glycosyltransferase, partial [Actinomycetales bacterium]|nr:glycosyltransferase [Actinomycetales bacterium]
MAQDQVPSKQSLAFADLLLTTGLITAEQLDIARRAKAKTGDHVDETLLSLGAFTPEQLRSTSSAAWQIPPYRPGEPVDPSLTRRWSGQAMLSENWMPLRRDPDGVIVVATAREPDTERRAHIREVLGERSRFEAATSRDLRELLLRVFDKQIADEAANELFRQNPALSARITFSRGQKVLMAVLAALLVVGLVLAPIPVVVGIITAIALVFLAGTAFKFFVALAGARFDVVERVSAADVAELRDEDLPRYTVLVPVFREENIVAQLVDNLGAIDYPADKLEVLVLIEEADALTRDAYLAASPPPNFHLITIPAGQPQTKPRACNVGLFFATGEYLVIYDAEDTPDPDQLKKCVVAFERAGERTVCIQAALSYFNADENALTRMFTLEYNYWFDYMLAGLDAADLPIPLGGTSNHFRTSALTELGGWDPYNVTEDADLGIRSSALGYRVGVIDSTTMEEANTSIPNFIRQRSRWIKGYMQTTLVHARRPRQLIREIGLRRFLAFATLIGGTPATFLGVIPLYLVTLVTLILPNAWLAPFFPVWLLWLCLVNFIIGSSIMVYLSMMGPFKRARFDLILWALLNPVYWILHSIASYQALWELFTRPHYWQKMTCPGFLGHLSWGDDRPGLESVMPAAKPEEFRRRAVELARLGERPVAEIA